MWWLCDPGGQGLVVSRVGLLCLCLFVLYLFVLRLFVLFCHGLNICFVVFFVSCSITEAYARNPDLASLLVDPMFAEEINSRQLSWRRVVTLSAAVGIPIPAFSGSLNYMDAYRRAHLPANLTQAQRDFFGAHTYMRLDGSGPVHTEWTK